jgi:hypothetical protein
MLPLLALTGACEGGGPARSRVLNESAGRVYLQVAPEGYWQLERRGKVMQARDACGVCNCSERDCAICGLELGAVEPLDPGSAHSWEWDGRVWKQAGERNGLACERSELLEPGRAKLTVFHGTEIREAGADGTWLEPPLDSTSVDFNHAAEVEVDVVIR